MKMLRHTILALAIVVIAGVALNRVEAQLVSGASGLMVVSHDGTLIGNGTVGSPLGVASAARTATPTASPTPTAVPSATPTPTAFNVIGGSVNANGTVNPVEKAPVSVGSGGSGTAIPPGWDRYCGPGAASIGPAAADEVLAICDWFPAFSIQTQFNYYVANSDASNNQDIGLCSLPAAFGAGGAQTCTLIADIGAQKFASTGWKNTAVLQNAGCTASHAPSQCCSGSGTGTCPVLPLLEPAGYYCRLFTQTAATTARILACSSSASGDEFFYSTNAGASSGGVLPSTLSITINATGVVGLAMGFN